MDCIFNELSLEEQIDNKGNAMNLMRELIMTCKQVNELCKKPMKLRVASDFWQKELIDGYTVINWLRDSHVNRDYRSLLNKMLDAPAINENKIREMEYLENNFEYQDNFIRKKCEGLGVAYVTQNNGTLALSLNSHPRWDKHEIELLCYSSTYNKKPIVKHASQKKHIDKNRFFILSIKLDDFDTPSLSNPFPNLLQSNKLVDNDWSVLKQEIDKYRDQRLSSIQRIAHEVAIINGYKINNHLSSLNQRLKNSRREIYEAGNDRAKVYLSVDFEKGAFELCNYAGEHKGEYKFNGDKSGDAKAEHDIIL